MDIRMPDTSDARARQLRDEPQSGRYPTRGYQQRQPSLERGVADQTDLKIKSSARAGSEKDSTTLRRERSVPLTKDSHINDCRSAASGGLDAHSTSTFAPPLVGRSGLLGRPFRRELFLGKVEQHPERPVHR